MCTDAAVCRSIAQTDSGPEGRDDPTLAAPTYRKVSVEYVCMGSLEDDEAKGRGKLRLKAGTEKAIEGAYKGKETRVIVRTYT